MILSFKNLTIKYGDKLVVKDVNIDIPKGKIVCLVGKNGSGKSSILKTLTNTVKMKTGQILLNNEDIKTYNRKDLAKKLAVLPQIYDIPADIDVETLVSYGRYPYKKFGKSLSPKDKEIIEQTIESMNLQNLRYQKMNSLSGGERQRARIAMAICQQPEVLVLDEPTTYLDISYQLEILQLISDINREMNMSILMVLHDLNFAAKYSDIIYVLDKAEVSNVGSSDLIIKEDVLNEVFNIDVAIWEDNPSKKPFFIPLGVLENKENK